MITVCLINDKKYYDEIRINIVIPLANDFRELMAYHFLSATKYTTLRGGKLTLTVPFNGAEYALMFA